MDHKTLRRCVDWRYKVESASFAEDEKENAVGTDRLQHISLTFTHTMQINTKVAHAIASIQTSEEAEEFLNVADNIRAERAAELAMLQHLLEQCRREMQVLESKVAVARGRVIDADRGIATMRQFMTDKGVPVVSPAN